MGYDIKLINITINDDDTVSDYNTVAETYLSYNWSNLKYIWYINDYDGRSSIEIHKSLNTAIATLVNEGIEVGIPDITNPSWSFGVNANMANRSEKTQYMPIQERKSILLYHLNNFLKLTIQFPNAYWITDSNDLNMIHHDVLGLITLDSNTDDDIDNINEGLTTLGN